MKNIAKILTGILLFLTLGIIGNAQNPKGMVEIISSPENVVKNAPFSAEAVSESVQMLADGNKIVRTGATQLFRDGEGRFRREENNSFNILGSLVEVPPIIFIIDPIIGLTYSLDIRSKTVRQSLFRKHIKINFDDKFKIDGGSGKPVVKDRKNPERDIEQIGEEIRKTKEQIEVDKVRIADKEAEIEKRVAANGKRINEKMAERTAKAAALKAKEAEIEKKSEQKVSKPDNPTKTESLGVKDMEGVAVEGTRSTTTIAAGVIGNERPINIVYEKWYSKDLQLIVYSKHSDPRFGEQTYRLTKINRSEPERSLFTLPADYKVLNELKPPPPPKPPEKKNP